MNSLHHQAGFQAAIKGDFRAAPENLKIITQPWRDWYLGFDAATESGKNKNLTSCYSNRKPSIVLTASIYP